MRTYVWGRYGYITAFGSSRRIRRTGCVYRKASMENMYAPQKRHARQEALHLRTVKADCRRTLMTRAGALESLPEDQTLLESVLRAAPIGIGLVRNDVIVEVNDRLCTMTGYRPEELIGQSIRVLYPAQSDYDDVGQEAHAQIGQQGTPAAETCWQTKTGCILVVLLSCAPLDPSDESKGVTITALDITEYRRALEEKDSVARFPSENPYPVFRIYSDGRLLYANPASGPLLAAKGTCPGGPAPADWMALAGEALESERIGEIEVEYSGRTFYIRAVPLPHLDYVNFYATDVTERRQAEQDVLEQKLNEKRHVEAELAKTRDELVRKTRLAAIGQMSASIAHDLRNPLGAVRNAAYLLKRRLPDEDPRLLEHLGIIEHEVIRANRIITNLLDLTRSRAPYKEAIDFASLIRRILNDTQGAENVQCHLSLDSDPFVLQADMDQISRVFANILDNAVQAMNGSGELIITATRETGRDILGFQDTGPGWPESIRDQLFEPLVSAKTTGTGLGLAICRQIVQSHNGTIEAIDGPTPGATVRIVLPREPETSA